MSFNIARAGAQAFNKAKSYVESFGKKQEVASYGQDLAKDIYDVGEREVGLLDQERALKGLQRGVGLTKYVGVPALALAGLGLAVMSAPALLTVGVGSVAALTLGAAMVDGERAKMQKEDLANEKSAVSDLKKDLYTRYQSAAPEEKESAFEAIQDVRRDRIDVAADMREEAKEVSWPASSQFKSFAKSVERMEAFLPQVETAPPAVEREVKWSAAGQDVFDHMFFNTPL